MTEVQNEEVVMLRRTWTDSDVLVVSPGDELPEPPVDVESSDDEEVDR